MDLSCQPETVSSMTYSAILFKTSQFHIIFLYLSSNYNKDDLFALLDMWIEKDVPTAEISSTTEFSSTPSTEISSTKLQGLGRYRNFVYH